MNGIAEIIRADPGLPQQVDRIVALSGGRIGIIGVRVDIDPERYSQTLAFTDVSLGLFIQAIAPTVA